MIMIWFMILIHDLMISIHESVELGHFMNH